MSQVISDPDEITPELLTEIMRRSYTDWLGRVSSVQVVLTKSLFVSRVARLAIEYSSDPDEELPRHLFLKFSSADTDIENSSKSEVEFYNSVGAEMNAAPLVRCYDAAFSPSKGRSHILLEDLFETHFQTENGKHPSPIHSELAVKSLARFHASWWEHPKIGNGIGSVFDNQWLESFIANLKDSVTKFMIFLGSDLLPEQRKEYEQMLESGEKIWGRLTDRRGLTITHGDTHWWNFFFPKDPENEKTRIFDWQLWHIDQGARDLAFLIALGGFAERRPELETHLLHSYYESLVEYGLQDYSWDDFWDDYRRSAIRNLNIPVIFWSQGKHPSIWKNALERAFKSFDELKCGEML